ncbi:unnamed protein product [Rotaria sordida]|uniref:ATP-dependent DNA helicase n=1 Tax=Rotaria sordida TaxID=392033 RepID=A0A815CHN7_9BILA|nr:unnamed protein product [Rotaria sordida]
MKYNAHINVEICATVKSIKYLFKYIFKEHDCTNIKLQRPVQEGAAAAQGTLEWDEIKEHLDARYVSAPVAAWRLFEFPLHDKSHAIIRLAIHLLNQQPIYFTEGNERQALERAAMKDTTLTAWFKLNSKNPDARQYLYHDIPQHSVFEHNGTWKQRLQSGNVIGVHVMTVAWTGMAASSLPEGRTVHSRFKLPAPILETSISSIRPNSKEAEEF